MEDVFVGRQPIYDTGLDVVAYELLFRSGSENRSTIVDGDSATGRVLLNTLIEIGLDNLVGDRLAFINITRRFLTDPHLLAFDKDRIALEILETIEPDEDVIAAVRRVSEEGFRIVLDDFVYAEKYRELVELADVVKIDFRAMTREQLHAEVETLRDWGVRQVLAEKIETLDEFEYCQKLGFDLYQGYFLSRPKIVRGKAVRDSHVAALQLLAKMQQPDVDVTELAEIIGRDVRLSYKLLLYINSSAMGLPKRIESIRQAISMLGLKRLRMLATVFSLAGVNNKPQAIINIAMTRSIMCELLARALKRRDFDSFSVVGLFSTLDVLLDSSIEDVLKPLPLTDDVKQALLSFEGPMGAAYRCILAAERSEWDAIECPGLSRTQIHEAYLQAVAATETAPMTIG
jgi:c-di-GMP phosphodiesterase